ncbi:hypothetical protein ES705_11965 [subsurface metagenome]
MNEKTSYRNANSINYKIGNEIVVKNQLSQQYYILNELAAKIWELSDGIHSIKQIIDAILKKKDCLTDVTREDIIQTLEGLSKLRIIIIK